MILRRSVTERILDAYKAGRGYTWKDTNGCIWAFDHDRDIYCQGQCNTVRLGRIQLIYEGQESLDIEIANGVTLHYTVQ